MKDLGVPAVAGTPLCTYKEDTTKEELDMYRFIERLHTLYGLLQDEQSKEIFQARFALDMEPSLPNVKRLVSLGYYEAYGLFGWGSSWKEVLENINRKHKKIILYGAAQRGIFAAMMLEHEHIDLYGFCDDRRFPDGLLGKPVLTPDELLADRDECYVIPIAGKPAHLRICQFLQNEKYPEDHILDLVDAAVFNDEKQYFEFPELYRRGTAFIDGGCYDCESSYKFAEWCEGAYSAIVAFEPDPDNYAMCCEKIRNTPLPNFQLVNAGLSGQEGTAVFDARKNTNSRIMPTELGSAQAKTIGKTVSIRTSAIDDIVGSHTVGFIKMDIEGAEFDALHGAKNTILRDKPLLAICVYHLRGDVFAIMDYLHQLLPEYRFLLRHYGVDSDETVLYASVDL